MIDAVLGHCRESWTSWFPGEPTPELSPVLLTRTRVAHRAIMMILPDGHPEPRLTAKLVWSEDAQDVVEAEAATLRSLPEHFPGMAVAVPQPLAVMPLPTGAALIMTSVPGKRWRLGQHHWRESPGVASILARCTQVMDATSCDAVAVAETHPLSDLLPVVTWATDKASTGSQRRLFQELAAALATSTARFDRRWQHGDLATGNVLLGRVPTIGIVDWELASSDLPGWFDSCYVACAVALEVGSGDRLVRWIVDDVLAPRWRQPFPVSWGLALTALLAAQRSWTRRRSSYDAWLSVASDMLRLPSSPEEVRP